LRSRQKILLIKFKIMKTLIVYYSKTGQTEKVALDLAKNLDAETEKIIDQTKRSGILGWIFGGRDAMKKKFTEIGTPTKNPADFDLVIFGSPIWAWTIVPAIRTYLEKYKKDFKNCAFFCTSDGTGAEKIITEVEEIVGKKILAGVGFNGDELKDQNSYHQKLDKFLAALK
jgi:flavodoxin